MWVDNDGLAHLVARESVVIPPFHDVLVNVTASVGKYGTCLVLPENCRVKGTCVLPSLYTLREGSAQVHVMNLTPAPLSINSGVRLIDCEVTDLLIAEFELPASAFSGAVSSTSHDSANPFSAALAKAMQGPFAFSEGKEILGKLLNQYPDILPTTDRPLGRTHMVEHSITLEPGSKPVYIPAYKIPHSRRQILEEEVRGMLQQGLIQPSTSPWSAPMLLVPKRQHGFRPVCDFRRLNKVTVLSPFPIPNLRQLLQDIGGKSKVFSSIDLAKGFLQVPLAEDSRPYTAFSTHVGHFEFLVSPMGLRNSPLTFSRLMALVLQGLINDQVLVYLDDILVCSPSIRDHEARLRSVFQRLSDAGLTINPAKCKFFQSRLDFLGHSVSAAGIAPNEAKVKAVSMFPIPSDATQVKSFLGLAGFYRPFIKDFGRIAAPLTHLLKKDVPWRWGEEQVNAFSTLQHCLSHAPVLAFPRFDLPFILHTDASNVGLGAVLMQEHEGNLRPIGFASRVLTSAEKNYSVTDREMLAIVWALKYFRDIILGYKVMVHTDHMPLTSLNGNDPYGRRARYQDILGDFDVTFVYIQGRANVAADTLSRAPIENSQSLKRDDAADFPPSFSLPSSAVVNSASQVPPLEPLNKDEVYAAQRADKIYGQIIRALAKGTAVPKVKGLPVKEFFLDDTGLLFRRSQPKRIMGRRRIVREVLVVPEILVPRVLKYAHEYREAAHCGVHKAVQLTRNRFYFPRLVTRVANHVRSCKTCPLYKGHTSDPAKVRHSGFSLAEGVM